MGICDIPGSDQDEVNSDGGHASADCAVVIVSPHLLEADGLAGMLSDSGCTVPLMATHLDTSRLTLARRRPDVILIDACLCGEDMSAIRELVAEGFVTAVLVGTERDGSFIHRLLQAGASGCISCEEDPARFSDCIRMIARGAFVMSSGVAALMAAAPSTAEQIESTQQLNEHEKQIALMVAGGATNREIGEALFISEHTVKIHLGHALDKLHLRNRQQLAAYIADRGDLPYAPQRMAV